jgi:hypothetical protein
MFIVNLTNSLAARGKIVVPIGQRSALGITAVRQSFAGVDAG